MPSSPARPLVQLGAYVEKVRRARNVSIARLSKVTGVSRRHLSALEEGHNVSVDVLQRLMAALHVTELPLGDMATLTTDSEGVNLDLVLSVANDIEQGAQLILNAVSTLRAFAEGKTSNLHEERNAKAEELIRRYASYVRSLSTTEQLEAVAMAMPITPLADDIGTSRKRRA